MPDDTLPIGLIAGSGRLPIMVAHGIRASGGHVCGLGLRDHYDVELPDYCSSFTRVEPLRLGAWVRALRRAGVHEAVMVGRVSKGRMHDPLRIIRNIPDLRTFRLWYRHLRHDRRTAAVLAGVADVLAASGVTIIDSTTYITDALSEKGPMTRRAVPSEVQWNDLHQTWPMMLRVANLGIGQTISVAGGKVVAVEAVEGTDSLIERTGAALSAGWSLLKAPSVDHDLRADVPTVGPETIERLSHAGATCLALQTRRVIMVDKPDLLRAADRAGISVVGLD